MVSRFSRRLYSSFIDHGRGDSRPHRGAVLRVYESLRTTHLTELRSMVPGRLVYRETMYDFDESHADGLDVQQAGRWATSREILLSNADFIEINEPYMVRAWPSLLLYTTAARLSRLVLRKEFILTTYAIENNSPVLPIKHILPVLKPLAKPLVSFVTSYILGPVDRIAFGTPGARDNYLEHSPRSLALKSVEEFLELPAPCSCGPLDNKSTILFVGEFSDRKGIKQLMRLWDNLECDTDVNLVLIGQGPQLDLVSKWSSTRDCVKLIVNPPRDVIHIELRRAIGLALLSQSVPRWREQIGLPIMEGLAHGCEIISTDQTGYAEWLEINGHIVTEEKIDYTDLADRVREMISNSRDPQEIIKTLPSTSSRQSFDKWMNSASEG